MSLTVQGSTRKTAGFDTGAVAARGTVSASAALAWNRQSRRNRQSRQQVLTMSLDDLWSRA
jgi:hypothetical protein